MTTVQVVGIGIATVILVALVFSLIITRRKDAAILRATRPETPPVTPQTAAFLFEPPRDDLDMLGEQDQLAAKPRGSSLAGFEAPTPHVDEPTVAGVGAHAAGVVGAAALARETAGHEPISMTVPADPAPTAVAVQEPAGPSPAFEGPEEPPSLKPSLPLWLPQAGLEPWTPPLPTARAPAGTPPASQETPAANAESSQAVRGNGAADDASPSTAPEDEWPRALREEPGTAARTATVGPELAAFSSTPPEAFAAGHPAGATDTSRPVALSDIIVTTNDRRVDLADPEVRRMLKDLAKDEIDLAAQYRELGQSVDALMQLTEAERICTALGMTSHTKLIQQMIRELQE